MHISATTANGFLIEATKQELDAILTAVNGKKPEKLEIGQKIPAVDYAGSITKLKALNDSYDFRQLREYSNKCKDAVDELTESINKAANTDSI